VSLPTRALAVAAVLVCWPVPAAAEPAEDDCVDANTKAQDLTHDGRLAGAREQLTRCMAPSCPAMIRADCSKRLDELDAVQPSVVFDVKRASGEDLTQVRVFVDGRLLVERLDGSAIDVDPGEHVFRFEAVDAPPVTRTLVIKEGQKARRERVVLGAPVAATQVTHTDTPPAPEGSRSDLQRVVSLGLVAGGLASVLVGSVFGVLTIVEANHQRSDCASGTSCKNFAQAESDRSIGMTDGAVSTFGFVFGGALLAGGATLYFTLPSRAGAVHLTPAVGPRAASVSAKVEF